MTANTKRNQNYIQHLNLKTPTTKQLELVITQMNQNYTEQIQTRCSKIETQQLYNYKKPRLANHTHELSELKTKRGIREIQGIGCLVFAWGKRRREEGAAAKWRNWKEGRWWLDFLKRRKEKRMNWVCWDRRRGGRVFSAKEERSRGRGCRMK